MLAMFPAIFHLYAFDSSAIDSDVSDGTDIRNDRNQGVVNFFGVKMLIQFFIFCLFV